MKHIQYLASALLVVAALVGTSCEKEETYDVYGVTDNFVYIGNTSVVATGKVLHTPVGEMGEATMSLNIKSVSPVEATTKVMVVIDTEMAAAYNNAYGTSYEIANPDWVKIEGETTIEKGETDAATPVVVSIAPEAFIKLTKPQYIVAARIAEVNGNGKESKQRGTAYLLIDTESRAIKANVGPNDMLGTLNTNYSNWVGTWSTGTAFTTSQIFDGSLENGPQLRTDGADGHNTSIVIDMQTTQKVTGLRVARYYKSYWGGWWIDAYYFSEVKVSISDNKIDWKSLGTAVDDEMTRDSGYQYICFYGAVPTRYLKLDIESGGSAVSSLAELGVYLQ